MSRADLHIHTTNSDGTKATQEIINMCQELDIRTMAITDHDNIEGSKELIRTHPSEIEVYSGVELTIKSKTGRMHMLGYNIDLDNPTLNHYLLENRKVSIYNLLLYIEIIKKDFGIVITNEEIEAIIFKPGNIGRPDLANLLIRKGICTSVDDAFDRYLNYAYKKASSVKKGITYEEGIDLIKGAGGVPVLAHPNSLLLSDRALDKKVKEMSRYGLEGIETIHINESEPERKYYHELAMRYNLLETGGTDYHGDNKPNVLLGSGINNNVHIKPKQLSLTRKIESRYK